MTDLQRMDEECRQNALACNEIQEKSHTLTDKEFVDFVRSKELEVTTLRTWMAWISFVERDLKMRLLIKPL